MFGFRAWAAEEATSLQPWDLHGGGLAHPPKRLGFGRNARTTSWVGTNQLFDSIGSDDRTVPPHGSGRTHRSTKTVQADEPDLSDYFGTTTASITWITPLLVIMSALISFASSTLTPPSVVIVSSEASTVFSLPALTSLANPSPGAA